MAVPRLEYSLFDYPQTSSSKNRHCVKLINFHYAPKTPCYRRYVQSSSRIETQFNLGVFARCHCNAVLVRTKQNDWSPVIFHELNLNLYVNKMNSCARISTNSILYIYWFTRTKQIISVTLAVPSGKITRDNFCFFKKKKKKTGALFIRSAIQCLLISYGIELCGDTSFVALNSRTNKKCWDINQAYVKVQIRADLIRNIHVTTLQSKTFICRIAVPALL